MAAQGVSPADAYTVLKTLDDVWSLASERMLEAVARRLAAGIEQDGWAERKARETLALRAELAGIMSRVSNATPAQVQAALAEAHRIGTTAAATLGRTAIDSRPEAVQQLATRTTQNLRGTVLPVIRAHSDLYRRVVVDSELAITTGTTTRREEIARTVDRLLAEGGDRFVDRSGRRWHLDVYARMAGRTVAGQTVVQGQLDQMVAEDRDLVIISDSARECERCRPWEGRVLSVTGSSVGQTVDGRRITATVGEARGDGLWHPNCRHRADPYVPGLTRKPPPKADPEGAKAEQKLRDLERRARDLKRRETAVKELGDTATAKTLRQQIRANSARIKQHTDDTGLLRRRDREKPLGGGAPAGRATPNAQPTPRPQPEPVRATPPEPPRPEPTGPQIRDMVPDSDDVTPEREAAVREALSGQFEGRDFGELRIQIDTVDMGAGQLDMMGTIRDRHGEIAGYVERYFHRDEDGTLWVEHALLQLEPEFQGQGFAKALNNHLYNWYRESGVKYVATEANIDVGGYTWAGQGFDWATEDTVQEILKRLTREVDKLEVAADPDLAQIAAARDVLDRAARVPFGSDGYPSAYEISQLGRAPGAEDWIGRRTMLGSLWNGVKWL
ncbi:phage minor capsid protein [Actinophytocola sediminis]